MNTSDLATTLQALDLKALQGTSIIAGHQLPRDPGTSPFYATAPATGDLIPLPFHPATLPEIDAAATAAWRAFHTSSILPPTSRAELLTLIATHIDALGETLITWASTETGLTPTRIRAERDRTTYTLRLFADLVREGRWVRAAIDLGEPARKPTPKPDLRRMLRPLGPVAVFGAGNFPLAYSTAGGDTTSALAAGCPVVVKGHPGHPGTGELVALAITRAIAELNLDPGLFSYLHAGGESELQIGQSLVRHPCIRAVGFTGSLEGGRALARLGQERPDPIPVFAEMGSTNPVFLLQHALDSQAKPIADKLAASITNSNGQMCTSPGLIFASKSEATDLFIRTLALHLGQTPQQPMLNRRTADTLLKRLAEVTKTKGVELHAGTTPPQTTSITSGLTSGPILCAPALFRTTLDAFRASPTLHAECFGPVALVILCEDEEEILEAAALIQGSLTSSIFCAAFDAAIVAKLQPILEQRVGRLIYNGVPTGVEVTESMVHGGPFPATNQPHTTAVGPMAIERWCRPVCYQNAPDLTLPPELKNDNPCAIERTVNGVVTKAGV